MVSSSGYHHHHHRPPAIGLRIVTGVRICLFVSQSDESTELRVFGKSLRLCASKATCTPEEALNFISYAFKHI